MGQKQHQKNIRSQLAINEKDWKLQKYENDVWVVSNTRSNIEGEQVTVQIDGTQNVEYEMEIYYYRKVQESAIVGVYGAEYIDNKDKPLCGNMDNIRVLYQRIPRRLRELPVVSLPQGLYILSQSLRGFRDCFQKVGLFQITEDMIGVNNDGEVKVWLNQNFAVNHPPSQRPSLQITSSRQLKESYETEEKLMIGRIVNVVESKLEEGRFPSNLVSRIEHAQSFIDAYCQIESYCDEKDIWIPDKLAPTSIIISQRKSRTKLDEFKNYVKNSRNDSRARLDAPHASYVPNVAYSYPRVTYVESPKVNHEVGRTRNINAALQQAVSSQQNGGIRNMGTSPRNVVVMPQNGVNFYKNGNGVVNAMTSPSNGVNTPHTMVWMDSKPQSPPARFIVPGSLPQSPQIQMQNGRQTPFSPKF